MIGFGNFIRWVCRFVNERIRNDSRESPPADTRAFASTRRITRLIDFSVLSYPNMSNSPFRKPHLQVAIHDPIQVPQVCLSVSRVPFLSTFFLILIPLSISLPFSSLFFLSPPPPPPPLPPFSLLPPPPPSPPSLPLLPPPSSPPSSSPPSSFPLLPPPPLSSPPPSPPSSPHLYQSDTP